MKKSEEDICWRYLPNVLRKWAREECLSKEDKEVIKFYFEIKNV